MMNQANQSSMNSMNSLEQQYLQDDYNIQLSSTNPQNLSDNLSDDEMKEIHKKDIIKSLRPPKRASSAYACFSRHIYPDMRQELGAGATQPEIFSSIAKRWRDLSDDEKKPYILESQLDKERFMKEDEEYKKNRRKWEKNILSTESVVSPHKFPSKCIFLKYY